MKAFIYLITFSFLSSILAKETSSNSELEIFFNKWREFESPPLSNNAPDYTKSQFKKRQRSYKKLKKELMAFDTSGWRISWRADWQLIEAEMNGYDFNRRVLKPWERDPAFYQTIWMYQSDVPAHEGPTNHALLEFWQYNFPLNEGSLNKLTNELNVIPPFLIQARENLTGNAKDLWIAGIRDIETQLDDLVKIEKIILSHHDETDNSELFDALKKARTATELFTKWLKKESPKKNGPSGIGKDNYTWYQKNVHLIPLSWEEEVQLLKRELNRAWSSLKLEEHRNRNLPKQKSAQTEEEFSALTERSIKKMMKFLKEENIMYIKPNMEPALREHKGIFSILVCI